MWACAFTQSEMEVPGGLVRRPWPDLDLMIPLGEVGPKVNRGD